MAITIKSSNGKFNLKLITKEKKYEIYLEVIEKINLEDIASTIFEDLYVGKLGFYIRGHGASCIVKENGKEVYKFEFSEPESVQALLSEIERQVL